MKTANEIIAIADSLDLANFPGLDAIGTHNKLVADAVVYACRTVFAWRNMDDDQKECVGTFENWESFGRLEAMIEYGVVNPNLVYSALEYYKMNRKRP